MTPLKQTLRQSIVLAALSGLRLVLLAVTQAFIFARLGTGSETDALVASGTLPQLAATLLANALTQVLVPLFASASNESSRRNAWALMVSVAGGLAVLAILLALTAEVWVGWLVPGFSPEAKVLAIALTRIQLMGMMFVLPYAIVWSLHCARGMMVWGEGGPMMSALVAFALLVFLLPRFGVQAAAWIIALRAVLDFVLLAYILGKWIAPDFASALLRTAWQRVRYLLFGAAYYGTEPLVNQLLISFAPAGSLTMLFLGQQLYGVSAQIVNKALAAPVMPYMSVSAHAARWDDFRQTFRKRLMLIGAITLTAFVFVVIVGNPVLQRFAGRIAFTSEQLLILWQVLVALGGLLIAGWLGTFTTTTLHAAGDTRSPMILSLVTYTLYTPLKFLAFGRFGLLGLAIATSIYYLVNLIGQLIFIRQMLRNKHNPDSLVTASVVPSNAAS
jgi:putative peptidoglycan lipid II flippase